MSVSVQCIELGIPTYGLGEPEKLPVFFEKRVYQGSSGKVYPVPFIDRLDQDSPPQLKSYQAIVLENDCVRLQLLPEIGGRIFLGQDKKNNDYDFFYRQDVIKPALVGLAGPWISGGVEFNWPQHHRPGTFMPADWHIEEESDGARTVWMSEHDPITRMKGMHGIRLRPQSSRIELRGRLFNRTPITRSFLWWANVAARVHDDYESFFPPDVHYVADHAVRAMTDFPCPRGSYYGVDYSKRKSGNNLAWYKNIPVPMSYMVCQTAMNFFGGYDHKAGGGFIHVADRFVSPGKKQWTWGHEAFGRAWDHELTDHNGPYVELMAGVYTDNQPDFTYLLPYETKTFTQSWWPFQDIGPVQQATEELALRCVVQPDRTIDIGVVSSIPLKKIHMHLVDGDRTIAEESFDLAVGNAWRPKSRLLLKGEAPEALCLTITDHRGATLLTYRPPTHSSVVRDRQLATEPPPPEVVQSADELFLIGEHLELYRHPTRSPEPYWQTLLKRDPGDCRAHLALGKRALTEGRFSTAQEHFEQSVRRLIQLHPNPVTGEAHYYLGLALRWLDLDHRAEECFAKATWNFEWRAAANHELALLYLRRHDFSKALEAAEAALDTNRQNNKAQLLRALALEQLGRRAEALSSLEQTLVQDPLDHWARYEHSRMLGTAQIPTAARNDAQTLIDLACDYAEAGYFAEAFELLQLHHNHPTPPCGVPNPLQRSALTLYLSSWLCTQLGLSAEAIALRLRAKAAPTDYLFPSRLWEQKILEWARKEDPMDRNACYALGNFYYDRKRHDDAIGAWEQATRAAPDTSAAWRNLGIALWNRDRNGAAALAAYHNAILHDSNNARLIIEYSQLQEKHGATSSERLTFLEAHIPLIYQRDDACVELAALWNDTGRPEKALKLLAERTFHPWEGGEGKVLRQYTRAHLLLGQRALQDGNPREALRLIESALQPPIHLGECAHPLQAQAEVWFWMGNALAALDQHTKAREYWTMAAEVNSDFQDMAVTPFSETTLYSGLALNALDRGREARALGQAMLDHLESEERRPAMIDYFATSLPNLLVFDEDPAVTRQHHHRRLRRDAVQLLDLYHPVP